MDKNLQKRFLTLWSKYFNNAELPFTFYYTEKTGHAPSGTKETPRCVVAILAGVR